MNLRDLPEGSVPDWIVESIISGLKKQIGMYFEERMGAIKCKNESNSEAKKLFDTYCQGLFVTLGEFGFRCGTLSKVYRELLAKF